MARPNPPLRTAIIDPSTGLVTIPWALFFQEVFALGSFQSGTTGTATITGTTATFDVVFAKSFSSLPTVVCSATSDLACFPSAVTTTGFTVNFSSPNPITSATATWIASGA